MLSGLVRCVQIKKKMLKNNRKPTKISKGQNKLNFTKRISLFTLIKRLRALSKNTDDINISRVKALMKLRGDTGRE